MGNRKESQWIYFVDRCSYKVRQGITVLLSRNIIVGVEDGAGAGGG
jgi:hypothetical protein